MSEEHYMVYRILNNITKKSYVGITIRYTLRKSAHVWALRRGKHHSIKLQNAWNKYGEDIFEWYVVQEGLSREAALIAEINWISHFDSFVNGYNMTIGGDALTPDVHLSKQCVWNGVEYESIAAAARALGVDRARMSRRIRKGYSSDADLRLTPEKRRSNQAAFCKPCVWNGIEYQSIGAAAAVVGVPQKLMKARLNRGYVCDADCAGSGGLNRKTCTWNGVEYPSQKDAAKSLGVSAPEMNRRIKKGYTSDQDMRSSND